MLVNIFVAYSKTEGELQMDDSNRTTLFIETVKVWCD